MVGSRGVPAMCIRGQTDLYGRQSGTGRRDGASLHLPRAFLEGVQNLIGPDLSIRPRSLIVLRLFHAQRSVQLGQQLRPFVGAELGEVLELPTHCRQILCAAQIEECLVRLAALH